MKKRQIIAICENQYYNSEAIIRSNNGKNIERQNACNVLTAEMN
jgi:hypothetical protein